MSAELIAARGFHQLVRVERRSFLGERANALNTKMFVALIITASLIHFEERFHVHLETVEKRAFGLSTVLRSTVSRSRCITYVNKM